MTPTRTGPLSWSDEQRIELDASVPPAPHAPLPLLAAWEAAAVHRDPDYRDTWWARLAGAPLASATVLTEYAATVPTVALCAPLLALAATANHVTGRPDDAALLAHRADKANPSHPTVALARDIMAADVPPTAVLPALTRAVAAR